MTSRLAILTIAAAGLLALAIPGTAAAEGCLYQGDRVTAANTQDVDRTLLCLNNALRLHSGLNALVMDSRLQGAATAHSADMVARKYFDHVTPDGVTQSARAVAAGYTAGVGENIGASNTPPIINVFQAWRNSPGHNFNLLYPPYLATGIGVVAGFYAGGPGYTATQLFGIGLAHGSDTGLDLYFPNERCRKGKLNRLGLKRRKRSSRERLQELNRKLRKACRGKPTPPFL